MAFLKKIAIYLIGKPMKTELSEDTMSNGLFINGVVDELSGESRVESPQSYCPGGYHPVHLGDHLGEKTQYKVLYKLGFGETSTVWLCVSKEEKYVAVKIHAATVSNRELQVTQRVVEVAKTDAAVAAVPFQSISSRSRGRTGLTRPLSFRQLGRESSVLT